MRNPKGGDAANQSPEFGNEREFIDAVRRRDPSACEALVRRLGGRMLRSASRYLSSEPDAADAVQEAFIAAFQAIDKFEGNSRLGTWLQRILINVCLMKLRSRPRSTEIPIESLLPQFDATGHQARPAPAWRRVRDAELERDEVRHLVRACIDNLPDDYRTILLLRDIEELDTEETATLLRITPGAVKTRLHRARQALRKLLEPHFGR